MNVDPCLAGYGLAAAVAAPYVLRRSTTTEDTPRLLVATWLLAGASVLGSWIAASISLAHHDGVVAQGIGLIVAVALVARLAYAWLVTGQEIRSSRRRHALAARLLGRVDPLTKALIIESRERIAYSIPRLSGGMVVVTTGARDALTPGEFQAVLSHERAHLAGRHHMLIEIGQVLARALPGLRLFRELRRRVPELLEMVADDAAARVHGPDKVAAAIASMSTRPTPEATTGAGGPMATARALRLTHRTDSAYLMSRVRLAVTASVLATAPFLTLLIACPHPW